MRAIKKLVFVVNHASFFASHRLPIAIQAQKKGFQVELITSRSSKKESERSLILRLEKQGITCHKVAFTGGGMNVLVELYGLFQLFITILKIRPSIVHCASPKGVLYGGMVSRFARVPSLVLAITGMGYGFSNAEESKRFGRRLIAQKIITILLNFVYGHSNKKIIVQNLDDKKAVESHSSVKSDDVCLIKGSGVDLSLYQNISFDKREKIVLLPARMLVDKGVLDFYLAAKELKGRGSNWRFILAGEAGYDNPSAISTDVISKWVLEGSVEWMGYVENMPELLRRVSIVCLPSYREGMPKVLLEAAAAGCAVITTNVIGCREAIIPGVTGVMVPVKSYKHLSASIQSLTSNPLKIKQYGVEGRKLAKESFDIKSVVNQTFLMYDELEQYLDWH